MAKKKLSSNTFLLIALILIGSFAVAYFMGFDIFKNLGLSFGSPVSCNIDPYNSNCFCTEGFTKSEDFINLRWGYVCQESINPTEGATIPLTNWDDAYGFALDQLGENVECTGSDFLEPSLELSKKNPIVQGENGCYTNGGERWVGFECKRAVSEGTNTILFDVEIDPNTGFIYKAYCSSELAGCERYNGGSLTPIFYTSPSNYPKYDSC